MVELEWEKVAVPFNVSVDVHALMQASLKKQIRNLSGYSWNGWDDAANYLLAQKIGLDDALTYANKSIENEDRYDNEMTKAKVLTALDRKGEAAAAEMKALSLASPFQLHAYARQLLGEKRNDEAFAIFLENARKHPEQWFVHMGQLDLKLSGLANTQEHSRSSALWQTKVMPAWYLAEIPSSRL